MEMTKSTNPKGKCKCLEGWPHVLVDGESIPTKMYCPCDCHKGICMFCDGPVFSGDETMCTMKTQGAWLHDSCRPFYILYKKLK